MSKMIEWRENGEIKRAKLEWRDALESRYGTPLNPRQVAVWESYLREINTDGDEIIEAIEYAVERKIRVKFRATSADLSEWIQDLRTKKTREGLATHQDAETRKLVESFVRHWVPKLKSGSTMEEVEQSANRQPVRSCSVIELLIEEVKKEVGE